jgi:hypothetical protein
MLRPPKKTPREVRLAFDAAITDDDIWNGHDRQTAKTTIVHGGEEQAFQDVDGLLAFFESPTRIQENWWGTIITQQTDDRNSEIELVNVTVQDAWIYEISRQNDHDYHLLIGIHPDLDQGRYLNAEIASIRLESPDAKALWAVRKSFRKQYEAQTGNLPPQGLTFTQPANPIHIRVSGSIFLDADHGRAAVGHHDVKNFTSWEIHPITNIQILPN